MSSSKTMPSWVHNDPILSWFWRRLYYYDQNVLLIVVGGTGSCKSGSSLTLANLMDRDVKNRPRFKLSQVVFKADEFISLVQGKLPKGSVIIWDEMGIEHDARNYYSLRNKLVKYVMQTFRYKNFMLIMTVPDLRSIDIGTRRLLHCYLEMKGPLRNKKMALGYLKFVQINPRTGKDYHKAPRFFRKGMKKLDGYYVPKPPAKLEEAYKEKKALVTKSWYKDFGRQLSYMENVIGEKEEVMTSKSLNLNELSSEVLENAFSCFDFSKGKFSNVLVQSYFEVSGRRVNPTFCKDVAKLLNVKLGNGEVVAPVAKT